MLLLLSCAHLGFSSLPEPYNDEERWLIAATGQCTHQTYIQEDTKRCEAADFEGVCREAAAAKQPDSHNGPRSGAGSSF